MQTPFKAVFSDIDGTLLNSQHQISPKTEQSVKRILQQGVPFVLASARPPLAIHYFNQQLASKCPMICYSGALILDGELKPLHSVEIAQTDLDKLTEFLEPNTALSVNYYAGLDWFCPNPDNEWTVQEGIITHLQAVKKPENLAKVHKVLVMANAEQIQQIEQQLKTVLPHLSIHRSKDEYLEIMQDNISKASAIRVLEQYFGITREQTVAFGDNFNDLDMLEYAGFGVAMGNAPAQIKQAADRVTLDNDRDGLAVVLDEIF